MATFVLVHGSTAGGWCWQQMTPHLRDAGHEVYTPTLTGLGERSHLLGPGVSLSTHIQDIVNVLFYEDLTDVILVGWSYGGMVITGIAEQAPERLKQLVYLDAFMPEDGESGFSILPRVRDAWLKGAIEVNGVRAWPAYSREWLTERWEITDPGMLDWMEARLTPMPLSTLEEPIRLPKNEAAGLPRSYICCTRSNLYALTAKAREQGMDYHELDSAHAPLITAPQELASLLLQIAGDRQ